VSARAELEEALRTLHAQPRTVVLDGPLASSQAFLQRVADWRAGVEASGAKHVALFVEERAEFAAALLGCLLAKVEVVLPGDTLPRTILALKERCDGWLGRFSEPLQPATGAPLALAEARLDPEAELTVFTSGSTGAPSAIKKALRQLSAEVASLEQLFGQGSPLVVHTTVSHQHIYGLLFTVLWPIAAGHQLSPRRLEYPEQLEAELARGRGVLVSSPAHLKRLRDDVRFTLEGLLAVFSSGGPLSEDGALRSRQTLGRPAIEIFGSSETGGIAWRTRLEGPLPAWTPMPGVSWRLSPGGTLEVSSAHLPSMAWFSTADVALDAGAGTFALAGRTDRIAKVEEKRVSLTAIEQRLLATGLLSEARAVVIDGLRVMVAVVGVPTVAGAALLTRGRRALVDALKAQLQDTVERVALPRRFRFVDELPVNAQGKTTEAAVLELVSPLRPAATWVEKSPSRAVLTFEVDPALRVLEGHFVEAAIVPGVAQLDWAIGWGAQAFGCGTATRRMDALKFQALMLPGQLIQLELDWNAEKSLLSFKYLRGVTPCASGRVTLKNA